MDLVFYLTHFQQIFELMLSTIKSNRLLEIFGLAMVCLGAVLLFIAKKKIQAFYIGLGGLFILSIFHLSWQYVFFATLFSLAYIYRQLRALRKSLQSKNLEPKNPKNQMDEPLRSIADLDKISKTEFCDYINDVRELSEKLTDKQAICIDAGWGMGKTTFINLVKNESEKKSSKDILWIDFNPWYFANQTELISSFFQTLTQKIQEKAGDDELFSDVDFKQYIQLISPVLDNHLPGASGIMQSHFKEQKNLRTLKGEINKALESLTFHVVIVMDDIDRMEPKEIAMVCKLVRLLSDFKRVTYILPFDYQKVDTVLAEHFLPNSAAYSNYLQKIITQRIPLKPFTYSEFLAMLKYYSKENGNELNNQDADSLLTLFIMYKRKKIPLDINEDGLHIKEDSLLLKDLRTLFFTLNSDGLFVDFIDRQIYGQQSVKQEFLNIHEQVKNDRISFNDLIAVLTKIQKEWLITRLFKKYEINSWSITGKNHSHFQNLKKGINQLQNNSKIEVDPDGKSLLINNLIPLLKESLSNINGTSTSLDKKEVKKVVNELSEIQKRKVEIEISQKVKNWLVLNTVSPREIVKFSQIKNAAENDPTEYFKTIS